MIPVETKDPLVSFLYQLLRDACTAGAMEKVVLDEEEISRHVVWIVRTTVITLSNGYIAEYAKACAKRLRKAWGSTLAVPFFTKRQWELLEEATEHHEAYLRQCIADAASMAGDLTEDCDSWQKEIEELKEINMHLFALKNLGQDWNGEKA